MLVILSSDSLTAIPELKRAQDSVSETLQLPSRPSGAAWTSDNSILHYAVGSTIHRYDPATNENDRLYEHKADIGRIICKGSSSLVFSSGSQIHILDLNTAKVTQSFNYHKSLVESLSISNDETQLASASSASVVVHSFTAGSHSILRGVKAQPGSSITCAFHPHTRTRLLVGVDKQLHIFDTSKNSGPVKSIPLPEISGSVISLSSSPFSKTLVGVAMTGGIVCLVDLEKEKGVFRTLNLQTPITCASFSAEGAALYFGSNQGQLLIMDLRGLDKPPRSITVNSNGAAVECLSIQRKLKSDAGEPANLGASTLKAKTRPSDPQRRPSTSKPLSATSRPEQSAIANRSKTSMTKSPPSSRVGKPVLSPARDPLSNSSSSAKGAAGKPPIKKVDAARSSLSSSRTPTTTTTRPIARLSSGESKAGASGARLSSPRVNEKPGVAQSTTRRTRTVPSASTASTNRPSSTISQTTSDQPASEPQAVLPSVSEAFVPREPRRRTLSSASAASSRTHTRPSSSSSTSRPGSVSGLVPSSADDIPPVPPLPISRASSRADTNRTPSPDLPSIDLETPLPPRAARPALTDSLGTSNKVTENVPQDKGKKAVGFKEPFDSDDEDVESITVKRKSDKENLAMQISPRRPSAVVGSAAQWATPGPSPLRRVASQMNLPGSPGGSAQEFLRAVVRDAMLDLHAESRAEMTGLHLDMIRMGRTWKKELREMMDEYVGDLKDIREENQRLREENERLRRGY